MTTNLDDIARALADYEIGREIGRGEYGIIWSGRHRQLHREVAIKQLAGPPSPEQSARFRREARILAQLDHPHVVRVYDYREDGELRLYVMELLGGGTLADRRAAGMGTETALASTLAAASGLHHVHEHGILHRDVKPDNVMFDQRGTLKVTDFGIARDDPVGATALNLTHAGAFFGTPAYVSPEQAGHALGEGWPSITAATDQYSLAAILYELLSGLLTHDASGGAVALCTRRMNEPARPLRSLVPSLAPEVEAVVLRALSRQPADRYPSTEAFAVALAVAARTALGPDWLDRSQVQLRDPGPILRAATGPGPGPADAAAVGSPGPVDPLAVTARDGLDRTAPLAAPADGSGGDIATAGRSGRGVMVVAAAVLVVLLVAIGAAILLRPDSGGDTAATTSPISGDASDQLHLTKAWSSPTGGKVFSSPAVAGGTVIVGSDDGSVRGFDATSGGQSWKVDTGGPVRSSPTVTGGRAYVGSYDGSLRAIDVAAGHQVWSRPTGIKLISSPVVAGNRVLIGADHLAAFDVASGDPVWTSPDVAGITASSPAIAGDLAVVGSTDRTVYGVSLADGSERWHYPTGGSVVSSPTIDGGVAYIGSTDGHLYAIDAATGRGRWGPDLGAPIESSPVVVGDRVIVGTRAGRLVALNTKDGSIDWTFTASDAIKSSPLVMGDTVVVGSDDGSIYAIDLKSGKRLGRFTTKGPVLSSPTATGDRVVVGSDDGSVYAIEGFDR